MAAGLPMVVTDAGGNAELVQDGERGFVVQPEQPPALAQAMLREGMKNVTAGVNPSTRLSREQLIRGVVADGSGPRRWSPS